MLQFYFSKTKKYILCFSILFIFNFSFSQQKENIKWNDIKLIDSFKSKLIFIDVYTHWCGWCKEMDRTTFENVKLIKYINEKYIPIKFNAEQKENIFYDNVDYKFEYKYNVHELAIKLSNGNLAYPLTIILNPNDKNALVFPGYKSATDFELILKYLAETKEVNSISFDLFRKNFKYEW